MKFRNHQFAIKPTSFSQILKELKAIHFYTPRMRAMNSRHLLGVLLEKAEVNFKTPELKAQRLKDLMATPDQNAFKYLNSSADLTTPTFYNLALQLLHCQVHLDFELSSPLSGMKQLRLPLYNPKHLSVSQLANHKMSVNDLLHAWYLLLNTHTKLGQTYLDDLASDGYLAQFDKLPKPLFFNGKTVPVFDTRHLIHEIVYVEAPLDTDHDGHRDLLRTDVIRPSETNQGLKVPVLFTASPYNLGTNDTFGARMTHDVNVPLVHKQPNQATKSAVQGPDYQPKQLTMPRKVDHFTKQAQVDFDRDGWTYTLNDYFLARGYAVVYSAGIGTKDSSGLRTVGSPAETIAAKSIVEWLAGNRLAFTSRSGHTAIKAWWSNHRIAMTGRSYLGTLSTAVATTGVKGLKACVVEAGISNWYDYYRENGLVTAPGGFQGEDCDVLAEETFSRQKDAGDYHRIKAQWHHQLAKITAGQDRRTGNYNRFWDARNYIKAVPNVKADMLIVHGLNDWNVKPINAERLWKALKKAGVQQKLILHQGQHIYINNFQSLDFTDMVNLWLTNKLWNVNNSADQLLPRVLIQDNTAPETWRTYPDWCETKHQLRYGLNQDTLSTSESSKTPQTFNDFMKPADFKAYCNDPNRWLNDLLSDSQSAVSGNRLIFKTAKLAHDLLIDGRVDLNLRIRSDHNVGLLSAMLVDYGAAHRLTVSPQVIAPSEIHMGYRWKKDDLREFKLQKSVTPFKKIATGHMNLQNRHNSYRVDPLEANCYYQVNLKLQPTFFHALAGHQLGLVIYATDFNITVRGNQKIKYMIDPSQSSLVIPIYKE